ncbi:hypothetical protein HYPDE_26413 [Hyphomicrobium denitrificans 1NES1]|uniref:Uncharacterized protein n=1 Tax=Hyphomicrobium denitrificans 1NES1 TaxID=670307 RepID=N0B1Z6_9HYPH|nr:hypothetical protein [Hyphomicrobium denitrificans]AGK56963.1 hypothetical protein HYPDE_26413 [Hyphomicrobium denitrificans 1NES1]
MTACRPHLYDGALFGTLIDWSALCSYVYVTLRRHHAFGHLGILRDTGEAFLELAERRMWEKDSAK